MNNLICVTVGDINGIGIEILLNLSKKKLIKNFILFTNSKILEKYLLKNKIKIKINKIDLDIKNYNYKKNNLNIFDYDAKNEIENTLISIKKSYSVCKKELFKGVITLPVNKKIINKKNKNFIGHTEYFEKMSNVKITNMLFIYKKLIITPLTTHVKITDISNIIKSKKFILNKIVTLNKTLKDKFFIKQPKIIISGLNPHSGENGMVGDEETNYIIPIIKKLKKKNIFIDGPISADSMLTNINIKKYDCFVFAFHDQALIPFKYISKYNGINYTSNLDIIRVSPDHGTAYNLVGKNIASNNSLLNCFKFLNKIKNK